MVRDHNDIIVTIIIIIAKWYPKLNTIFITIDNTIIIITKIND